MKNTTIKHCSRALLVAIICGGVTWVSQSEAREFRSPNPIFTPKGLAGGSGFKLDPSKQIKLNAENLPGIRLGQVPRSEVTTILKDIISKWNTPQMANTLANSFPNKSGYLTQFSANASSTSKGQLVSVRAIQMKRQRAERVGTGSRDEIELISDVVVSFKYRIMDSGEASEGEADYQLEIRQRFSR
ncbi:MAG: hypothetical protein OQJ97_05410 [Rhodospirillales bacterium]|nr:hypothetical protein [Rhodospirillales bacterium]